MANNDLLGNRLKALNEQKEALKTQRPDVVQNIASGADVEAEKPDFMKMAEALEAQKGERVSENENYVKDTIYIRSDLYAAMQALTKNKQGMKKKRVNEAYEQYLTRVYKEELEVDK